MVLNSYCKRNGYSIPKLKVNFNNSSFKGIEDLSYFVDLLNIKNVQIQIDSRYESKIGKNCLYLNLL